MHVMTLNMLQHPFRVGQSIPVQETSSHGLGLMAEIMSITSKHRMTHYHGENNCKILEGPSRRVRQQQHFEHHAHCEKYQHHCCIARCLSSLRHLGVEELHATTHSVIVSILLERSLGRVTHLYVSVQLFVPLDRQFILLH